MAKQQKTKHKRLSLFTKYYIVVAAAAIASLLALGIIFFVFLYNYWEDKSFESLETASHNIAAEISLNKQLNIPLERRMETETVNATVNAYAEVNSCDIVILDNSGILVKTNDNAQVTTFSKETIQILREEASNAQGGKTTIRLGDYTGKVITAQSEIQMGDTVVGTVVAIKEANVFFPYVEDILRLFIFSALG